MIIIIALYIILGIILAFYVILRFSVNITYYVNSETDKLELSAKWLFFKLYPRPEKPLKSKKKKSDKKKESDKKPLDNFEEYSISEVKDVFTDETEDEPGEKIKSLERELENQKKVLAQPHTSKAEDEKGKNDSFSKSKDCKSNKIESKKEKKENDKESGLKAKIRDVKYKWKKYKDYIPMSRKAFRKLLKQIIFYDTEIEITSGKDDAYEAAMKYGKLNIALFNGLGVIGTVFSLNKPKKAEVKCVFDKSVFEYKLSGKIKLRPSTILAILICFVVKFSAVFLKNRHKAKKQYKLRHKQMLNNKELSENEG